MKKVGPLVILIAVLVVLAAPASRAFIGTTEEKEISLAIFPFNDVHQRTLDMNITAVLQREFARYDFIEIVPVEVTREKLYDIEPSFLWAERDGRRERGGVLWSMEPKIIERISETVSAQFTMHGDAFYSEEAWTIDAFVIKGSEPEPGLSFHVTGTKDEEIPVKLREIAQSAAQWMKKENVLNVAEEDIRRYMGGMYSYDEAVKRMKGHVSLVPESTPLRGLLLDLYMKDTAGNRDEIVHEARTIMDMLEEADNKDRRYLLSLSLDPFDIVAVMYEEQGQLNKAIEVRKRALRLFPVTSDVHEKGLGRDYYMIARSYEKEGSKGKALESYRVSLSYLQSSSEYYHQAMDGVERLTGGEK